ncbi:MAG: HEAT repeat domain-containing protein [Planctomycetes bacterium]|nr:HEAT repeat domain-containing protein [Planctomycetota bacterium]
MNASIRRTAATVVVMMLLAGSFTGSGAFAEERLQWLYNAHPLEFWLSRLHAESEEARLEAVQAAGSFLEDDPERIQPPLIEALRDPAQRVREAAVMGLSWGRPRLTGPDEVIEALTDRLKDAQEAERVREWSARGLARCGVPGAKALAAAIPEIDDDKVRSEAVEWLSRMPHDLRELVLEIRHMRDAAQQFRPRTSQPPRELLRLAVETLEDPEERAYVRRRLDAADRIAPLAFQQLEREVETGTPRSRAIAMSRLPQLAEAKEPGRPVLSLQQAIESQDPRERFWAAAGIAAVDSKSEAGDSAVELIVEELVQDVKQAGRVDESLSWKFRLGTARSPRRDEIFRRIAKSVDDPDLVAEVRAVQLDLMEKTEEAAAQIAISILKSNSESARREAIGVLRRLGPSVGKTAAPVLLDLVKDARTQSQVVQDAIEALKAIDPEGKWTPQLDLATLERLDQHAGLVEHDPWLINQARGQGKAVMAKLEAVIESSPPQNGLSEPGVILLGSQGASGQAIRTLGHLGEPAVPVLRRIVVKYPEDVRAADAAQALLLVGPKGVDTLIELADHSDPVVRRQAVRVLPHARHRTDEVAEALISAARDDQLLVRRDALFAISRLEEVDPRGIPVVMENVGHDNVDVSRQAAEALRRVGQAAPRAAVAAYRKALRRGDSKLLRTVLESLKDYGEAAAEALPEIRPLVKDHEGLHIEPLETIAAMGTAAEQAEDLLRDELNSTEPRHRFWAAVALSRFDAGIESALPILIEFLDSSERTRDNSRSLQLLAVEAIGDVGLAAEPAIDPLLDVLRAKRPLPVPDNNRIAVVYDQWKARESAAEALGRIGRRKPQKVVAGLAAAIGRGGEPEWQTVASKAAIALRGFGAEAEPAVDELIARLKGHSHSDRIYQDTLLAIGRPAVPALAKALRSDYQTAVPAAEVLGQMGESAAAAVPALVDTVRDRGVHWAARVAAIKALGEIGAPSRPAIPYLEALATTEVNPYWANENWAEAARAALRWIRQAMPSSG